MVWLANTGVFDVWYRHLYCSGCSAQEIVRLLVISCALQLHGTVVCRLGGACGTLSSRPRSVGSPTSILPPHHHPRFPFQILLPTQQTISPIRLLPSSKSRVSQNPAEVGHPAGELIWVWALGYGAREPILDARPLNEVLIRSS